MYHMNGMKGQYGSYAVSQPRQHRTQPYAVRVQNQVQGPLQSLDTNRPAPQVVRHVPKVNHARPLVNDPAAISLCGNGQQQGQFVEFQNQEAGQIAYSNFDQAHVYHESAAHFDGQLHEESEFRVVNDPTLLSLYEDATNEHQHAQEIVTLNSNEACAYFQTTNATDEYGRFLFYNEETQEVVVDYSMPMRTFESTEVLQNQGEIYSICDEVLEPNAIIEPQNEEEEAIAYSNNHNYVLETSAPIVPRSLTHSLPRVTNMLKKKAANKKKGVKKVKKQPAKNGQNAPKVPGCSFQILCFLAIINSPKKRVWCEDIYNFTMQNFPIFRAHWHGYWRNSVRHALTTTNTPFEGIVADKVDTNEKKSKKQWLVKPGRHEELMNKVMKWRSEGKLVGMERPQEFNLMVSGQLGMPNEASLKFLSCFKKRAKKVQYVVENVESECIEYVEDEEIGEEYVEDEDEYAS